ncbi:hypothetical protein GCM10025869_21390 [Homoserinibacter gongjuensis]|uniref:Uncharacterized protein n=1 Tax=Homoserinibacter gongjuensis TaxID=1162968 RepID=A0ABQ6JWG9_9MICO|nr:hypothetical protein GCM10025869_21390 [Homoserinibacter gongjuensis]
MQKASAAELRERRGVAVAAVRAIAELEFVNGGGTGSLESTHADPAVTEIAAGSGLFGPLLFDGYEHFRPAPAASFVLSVVRRPTPDIATVLGGGWIASGPPDRTACRAPPGPRACGCCRARRQARCRRRCAVTRRANSRWATACSSGM